MTILILGGTAEAAELARIILRHYPSRRIVTSLAGRTHPQPLIPGEVRVGGFGGAAGLAAWMTANGVRALVDATHPFARNMADNARRAASATAIPMIKLARASWTPQADDRWIMAADGGAAAARLGGLGRRPFLTVGRQGLVPFLADPVPWALVRVLDREPPPAPGWEVTVGKGPFEEADEMRLMLEHGIDVLVTKASGGSATSAKLAAARRLRMPVLMIARPEDPLSPQVAGSAEAIAWLDGVLGD